MREDDKLRDRLYTIDVGLQAPGEELPKGAAKTLRVVEGVPASADRPAAKRLLGDVPIADDGSYQVQIPANTPVQLQLLDGEGRPLRASTWLWVRNHDAQGCVGCHEDPERTPPNRFVKALAAPAPVLDPPVEQRKPLAETGDAAGPPTADGGPGVRQLDRRTAMRRRLALATVIACSRLRRRTRRRPPPLARRAGSDAARRDLAPAPPSGKLPVFVDVLPKSGITWQRSFGDHELSNIVEGTGSGACVFDFDGDGRLDIYFPQGRWETTVSDNRGRDLIGQLTNALYRNKGGFQFEDVTEKAGVGGARTSRSAARPPTTTTTATSTCSCSTTRARSSTTTTATARSPTSPRRPASSTRAGR